MHDHHAVVFVEDPHVEVATAAATRHHAWDGFVGDSENQIAFCLDACLRLVRIGDVIELNLGGHDRRCRLTEKTAGHPDLTGGVRRSRDDGRLLDGHWHQHIVAVHAEVESHRKGQAMHPDHVFAHAVGDLEREAPTILQMQHGLLGKQTGVDHGAKPVFDVLAIKPRDAARHGWWLLGHQCFFLRCSLGLPVDGGACHREQCISRAALGQSAQRLAGRAGLANRELASRLESARMIERS